MAEQIRQPVFCPCCGHREMLRRPRTDEEWGLACGGCRRHMRVRWVGSQLVVTVDGCA